MARTIGDCCEFPIKPAFARVFGDVLQGSDEPRKCLELSSERTQLHLRFMECGTQPTDKIHHALTDLAPKLCGAETSQGWCGV